MAKKKCPYCSEENESGHYCESCGGLYVSPLDPLGSDGGE